MDQFRTIGQQMMFLLVLGSTLVAGTPLLSNDDVAIAANTSSSRLQEQGEGMMKNMEDMMMHGGMGDAKAIVHHCGAAARHAETLKQLSEDPLPHGPLNEVIKQCNRVTQLGIHADPGMLLNPAIKARAAARESMKALGLSFGSRS